jgi:uncharacterized OsmC-like protein
MEISVIKYKGELRTEAEHLASGKTIITDAPTDNHGKGEAFSPTDLMSTSLGACAVTIMGIAANNHGFPLGDVEIRIGKYMASNPRRVEKITVQFHIPDQGYDEKQKKILETAALNCPVSKSLHPDLIQEFSFVYH